MGAIVSAANCSVVGTGDGAYTVIKIGGIDGAFDASAVSLSAVAEDVLVRLKPIGGGPFVAGLTADPFGGNDGASIPRAFSVGSGLARPYESGTARSPIFPPDTYVWIRRSDGALDYLTGPTIEEAVARRIAGDAGAPLFFDSSIAATGGGFEVKFGAPADFAPPRRRRAPNRLTLGLGF